MLKYFDAHCHLEQNEPQTTGVGRIINAACYSDWGSVADLAFGDTFGAIGIHPWHISDLPNDWDMQLRNMLVQNSDLMVGEIGLDKHRPNIQEQISVFTRQLEIACELQRGVHIHSVGTLGKIVEILDDYCNTLPPFILFHRYSGGISQMTHLSERYHAYFSYNSVVNMERLRLTPVNRILSETDSVAGLEISLVADMLADAIGVGAETFVQNAERMLGKCHD
ncbi:MAG: TatD family hydrolase [Alphaproteobacteria bacterium]|nr:TatD family hydrolase [Alphaproteobacteria bacterium]